MSNENEFVASVNRVKNQIDSVQQGLKRDVEALIDRRFAPLREDVDKLRTAQSALDQINNLMALWDDRRDSSDLPNRIRHILEGVTSNNHKQTHHLDASEGGDNVTVEQPTNDLGGNDLDTNVPSTSTANDANVNESTSGNEPVNGDAPNLSSVSTTIDTEQSINETLMQQSNETTLDASKMLWWDSYKEDEDNYHQIDVPEGGQEGNDNQNEESIVINQSFENDSQIDQQMNNDDQNESPTLEQSKSRKRKRPGKSLASECSSLENSSRGEVSTSGPTTRSKRARVSSSLNRRESAEQLSTGSGVELSDEDDPNGGEIESCGEGEEGVEQSEDEESWRDSETELADEEKGHYRIEILKLKCIEDGCNAEVASRDELHDHLRFDHLTSSPYRCLAKGCFERGGHGLARHVLDKHSNICAWHCPHCTKTFNSQRTLYKHLHWYHFEGQFKCGYGGCHDDRVATLRSEIRSHQSSVHPKSTIYRCQTGGKLFPCDWNGCGQSFTTKFGLNAHQRIHQKVKPYKCIWNRRCYAATQRAHVITHIRIKHFGLPASQKEQDQRGIEDNRDPRDYLLNTITHQSDHSSTDSDDSDH